MKAKSVLITGTTSGLGRALLDHYATSGAAIVCVNRRRLPELESRYPAVHFACVDVQSATEVTRLLAALSELPELFILNAGVNRVDNDAAFDLAAFKSVIDTNLGGVVNFIQPLTEQPPSSVPRHIVAISSMVNYGGNPYALGYFSSKRALSACFDVWSAMYAGTDLIFQQVILGPVRTNIFTMNKELPSWMVWLKDAASASLEGTASAVARFAETRRARLYYPLRALPLFLGLWLVRTLVPSFFAGRQTAAGKPRRLGKRSTELNGTR